MDYQELLHAWNHADSDIEEKVQLNRKLVKEVAFKKIKSSLFEIRWTAYINLIVSFFWVPFLLRFSVQHIAEWGFLIPALILLGITTYTVVLEIRKLILFYQIKTDESVFKTQENLAKLKYLQLKDANSLYVLIPLFCGPFFIVTAKALLQLDLYMFDFFEKVLIYYTGGSLLVAGILVFLITTFPNKKLKEAEAFLNELRETE